MHKIVEKTTSHSTPDKQLLVGILATLSLFTTPMEFLELLILRYNVPLPKDKSDDSMEKYTNSFQAPIRLRVVSALKTWIAGYWHHFENDEGLQERLLTFVNVGNIWVVYFESSRAQCTSLCLNSLQAWTKKSP